MNRFFTPKIEYIKGNSLNKANPLDLDLRGVKIKGINEDLPNLIFFVDWFDRVENWIPFFTQKK